MTDELAKKDKLQALREKAHLKIAVEQEIRKLEILALTEYRNVEALIEASQVRGVIRQNCAHAASDVKRT